MLIEIYDFSLINNSEVSIVFSKNNDFSYHRNRESDVLKFIKDEKFYKFSFAIYNNYLFIINKKDLIPKKNIFDGHYTTLDIIKYIPCTFIKENKLLKIFIPNYNIGIIEKLEEEQMVDR